MSSEADKAGDLYTLDASSIYPFIAGIEKHIQPIVRKLRYFDFQKLFSKDIISTDKGVHALSNIILTPGGKALSDYDLKDG